ncbi:hypothetical protein [Xanthomonas arboricola]|uniref:hypothetical protein n=1 Tax=Xanthomonas arboricola TaxID=56448 RepID=UPI003989D0BF
MVQTRTTAVAISALLAVLGLGGCASFCGAPSGGPPPPPAPPQAQRGPPPPPPPSASDLAAMQACAQEQGVALPPPAAATPHPDAPTQGMDHSAFERCLASKGVSWPTPMPGGPWRDGPAPDGPHGPGEPHGPPPHDPDFDAALQACATAQGIALPAPDAPPLGPPPPALSQCLEAEGFAPPPRHG